MLRSVRERKREREREQLLINCRNGTWNSAIYFYSKFFFFFIFFIFFCLLSHFILKIPSKKKLLWQVSSSAPLPSLPPFFFPPTKTKNRLGNLRLNNKYIKRENKTFLVGFVDTLNIQTEMDRLNFIFFLFACKYLIPLALRL